METNRVDIIEGPSKEEMAKVYRTGGQKNVCFELEYGCKRKTFIDIIEIKEVGEKHVKMLAWMPAGFFMYSEVLDFGREKEKLEKIQVYIFYSTNTRKGYIEKGQSNLEIINSLNAEYKIYIDGLKADWNRKNKPPQSRDVYEVMRSDERKEVHNHIDRWGIYVTPFAEAWWKERGYGVVWPDDNSKPMQVYKFEDA